MEEILRIVRGNDFYLMVPVRRVVFTKDEHNEEVKLAERMYLKECSVLSVRMIGCDQENGIDLPFTVSEDDDSKLVVKIFGTKLHEGWYGLEVTGTYQGRRFRSYERKVFKVVENNSKGFATGSMYAGESSYQIDTMWVLYACPNYAHLYIDMKSMKLMQKGVVENGELYLDDNGKLCMRVRD